MEYKFDHLGVPVRHKLEGMSYYPEYKVWCSNYEKDPYRIEWIVFEPGNEFHQLIQTATHICFIVNDIQRAVYGKKILLKPTAYENYIMAFIDQDGVPIEFIQPAEKRA